MSTVDGFGHLWEEVAVKTLWRFINHGSF